MSIIYAIGDVHGCPDLLRSIIDFIDEHSRGSESEVRVFFLGDIVDKGPDSRTAMDIVCETLRRWPGSQLIIGNHDFMFLDSMTNQNLVHSWYRAGARTTLLSYSGFDDHDGAELAMLKILHREHFEVLSNAPDIVLEGRYAFIHAGIDPSVSIYAQTRNKLLQVRNEFTDHTGPLPRIVVHGHSPLDPARPVVTENRISLDTNAWQTGVLSLAVIETESDQIKFFATNPDGHVAAIEPVRLNRGFGTVLDAPSGAGRAPCRSRMIFQSTWGRAHT